MAARHRALARLHRHVPNVEAPDLRALSGRISDRATEIEDSRRVVGESVNVRDEVHERSLRGPNPGPNSPLLIRLVRYPYALRPVSPGRRPDTERPQVRDARERRESAPAIRELLEESKFELPGSPMQRDLPGSPPRPFARRRQLDDDDTVPVEIL